ncbi:MAG: glycosyltransferase family 4 protein [Zwartia sp.]|uniref:glycosyltransferase family 4 protein n=2 Tax=Zwartia sp. TaxID=2978004 RepID=UPI003C74BCFC
MKVLVLTQYFWPESFRINEVVESLIAVGCQVTVLTGQPNYPQGKVFKGYRAFGFGSELHKTGYKIVRVPLAARGKAGAFGLIANYLSFVFSTSLIGPMLLKGQQFDIIFVYAPSPIIQAIGALLIGKIKKAKVVVWIQDLWPQSLEATGFVKNKFLLASVSSVVRWIYRKSDLLLVQSQAFSPSVQKMAGTTPVRYHPNPGEIAFASFDNSQTVALHLDDGFNVVFAGNLGTVQALDTVISAAQILLSYPEIKIILVGSGSLSAWLASEIQRRNISNVVMPGRFPVEAMPGILNQASALLVSLSKNPIMSQTVPSKIQVYLATGKPIIACLDGEGARIIEQAGAGLACEAENAPELAQRILTLYQLPKETLKEMGNAGLKFYESHFEPNTLAENLKKHFELVLTNK